MNKQDARIIAEAYEIASLMENEGELLQENDPDLYNAYVALLDLADGAGTNQRRMIWPE